MIYLPPLISQPNFKVLSQIVLFFRYLAHEISLKAYKMQSKKGHNYGEKEENMGLIIFHPCDITFKVLTLSILGHMLTFSGIGSTVNTAREMNM